MKINASLNLHIRRNAILHYNLNSYTCVDNIDSWIHFISTDYIKYCLHLIITTIKTNGKSNIKGKTTYNTAQNED